MAMRVLSDFDLNGNELQNAVLHCLSEPPENAVLGQLYFNIEEKVIYQFDGEKWTSKVNEAAALEYARKISLSNDVTGETTFDGKKDVDIKVTLKDSGVKEGTYGKSITAAPNFGQGIKTITLTVDSKGRITDITEIEIVIPSAVATTGSAGLESAEDKTKLDGIEKGSQVNIIEHISVNGKEILPDGQKKVEITVPTAVSELKNDLVFQTKSEVDAAILAGISKSGHASFKKVSKIPTPEEAEENVLYLVFNSSTEHYDIYAKVQEDNGDYSVVLLDDTTVDLSNYATLEQLAKKVDKVEGKQLSSEDYTSAEKAKLGRVADGAQVNKIEMIKRNGTVLTPDSTKAVDIKVPTKTSEIANDSEFTALTQNQYNELVSMLEA